MSTSGFTSPFGANSNPFSPTEERRPTPTVVLPVMEEEDGDAVTSPTTPNFNTSPGATFGGPFEGPFGGSDGASDGSFFGTRHHLNPEGYPAQYNFARRTSVSAESLKPLADSDDNWTPPVYPKTEEQLAWLKEAMQGKFVFDKLDEEQRAQVICAFQEKLIPAKDIKVIIQGDVGDYFYVVQKGSFNVYKNPTGAMQPGPDGLGKHEGTVAEGGYFGEIALMHNALRNATVMSAEANCVLWALDRVTFNRILMETNSARYQMYDKFLKGVPALEHLTAAERKKLIVALKDESFASGDLIIKQGDLGEKFYILVSGEAEAYKDGIAQPVMSYKKGDFFGELALLNDTRRAASVLAKSDGKVATLDKNSFQSLLGPLEEILRRTKYEDVKTGVEDVDPLQSA